MLQSLTARLSIAAAMLALGATAASGATRNFTITSADIVDLYSATFDPALSPCGGSPTQECTFFGGNPPLSRAIAILQTGTGSGTMNLTYNDVTGEITQVNSMIINLPTLNLTITPAFGGSTVVGVIPGNALPSAEDVPFVESGTGTLGRDLNGPTSALVSIGQGTPDADQAPVVGDFNIFHHNDSPNQDAPDFAVLSQIVDVCTDNSPAVNCPLITFDLLTLDAVRYRLVGRIRCIHSSHSLVLKSQTANGSIYRVNLTAAANADCAGDTVDLTSGTTGTLVLNQSFNGETRAADVTLLGIDNKQVSSMTVAGVSIRDTSALVGARIYNSAGSLIASANINVAVGENQTISVPITATLTAGSSYRVAFFVPSSTSGNNGDLFDPSPPGVGGFPYIESQGLFQLNAAFSVVGDSFPNLTNIFLPRISVVAGAPSAPDGDVDGVPDATDNCPAVPNPDQADADVDGVGDLCDNCRVVANNSGAGAQCDSDSDGYGNRCDADLNNNGATNAFDSPLFRAQIGQPSIAPTYNKADINCNGAVNSFDTPLFRALIGLPPGPSGLACAGTVPCP